MPSPAGIASGDQFLIYVDGNAISAQTAGSVNNSAGERNISVKQSGKFDESRPTRITGTISGESLVEFGAAYGENDLWTLFKDQTLFAVKKSTETTGDKRWAAPTAYFTSLDFDYPDQDNVVMSYEIKITGPYDLEDTP